MRPPHHPPTSMTITKPLKMASINALLLSQSMHALVHGPDYYLSLLLSPSLPPSSPLPPHLSLPPNAAGYCRTNMCTKCQTVPWVSRTHLWW